MISSEKIAERILTLVTESPDQTIAGGRLSGLLRHYYPGFEAAEYHCKNLRAFIRKHLDKVQEAGQSGTDIIYKIQTATPVVTELGAEVEARAATEEPVPAPPPNVPPRRISSITRSTNHEAFRAFKSPNSAFQVYANKQTGNLTVALPGADLREPWVHVPRCNSETHLQIAKDFVATLPDEASQAPLTRTLDSSPKSWWVQFWPTVQLLHLDKRWLSFKNERLLQELETTLKERGISISDSYALREAAEDRSNAIAKTIEHRAPRTLNDDDTRKAILHVIEGLPLPDLRNLRLPAGEVIDAITKHL